MRVFKIKRLRDAKYIPTCRGVAVNQLMDTKMHLGKDLTGGIIIEYAQCLMVTLFCK